MRKAFLFIAGVFMVSAAAAQNDISKQMEVTKAYTPKVGRAAKLPVEPRMSDTVRLRPEIDYSITPAAWRTVFEAPKFRAASISATPYEKHRPFYLRAGAGYPFRSTADLYFNPYTGNSGTFGMFFNHRGSFSKIENELGVKPPSTEMLNGGGVYGSRFFRRYKLEGSIQYDNRLYNPYGVAPQDLFGFPANDPSVASVSFAEEDAFSLGNLRGRVVFGDTFADLSRFNFEAGLNAGASHASGSAAPGAGFYQFDLDAWARLAKIFNTRHGIEAGIYERGALGMGDFSGKNAVTLMLRPRYLLSAGKFSLKAGIDLLYLKNDYSGQNLAGMILIPQLEMRLDIAKGYFVPYLISATDTVDGSFEALSRRNPFNISAGATGLEHDLRLGFSGNAGGVFSYRIYGGASILRDYTVFCGFQAIVDDGSGNAVFAPMVFTPVGDNGVMFVFGGELGLSNLRGFSARFGWNLYKEEFNGLIAGNMPKYDANIELAYSHRDKFRVSAGAELTGKREFYSFGTYLPGAMPQEFGSAANTLPAAADIFVNAEARLFEGFWVFVEGCNLANRKLYPYNFYRGSGASVMAGIKAVF